MEEYKGTLEFTFYDRLIRIPYEMTNLGGSPHIYIDDKNGRTHSFFYRRTSGEWLYGYNTGPHWRADFLEALYQMFDQARERHGL